jgi:hypothetical protein
MVKKSRKPLAFLFGCKRSEQNGKTITIKTISGVSDTYPKEFEADKDFWVHEIHEGDFSALYAETADVAASFQSELAALENDDYYADLWNARKSMYGEISFRQWIASTAMSLAVCNYTLGRQIVEDAVIGELLGGALGMSKEDALSLFETCGTISEAIYDNELREFAKSIGAA